MGIRTKYHHSETLHNLDSPNEIVPVITKALNPSSVVDVGSGIGTFLHCFKKNGVQKVLGIDGAWVDKTLLHQYLSPEEFLETDLEQTILLNQRFDLAMSLEVAEHLREASADTFVKTLVSLSDVIVFSAAIPNQGGQNHINEQWTEYWVEKFRKHDYVFHDVFRPLFWDNKKIFWWYKQNMFLVTHVSKNDISAQFIQAPKDTIHTFIHPELFTARAMKLQKIVSGNYGLMGHLEVFVKGMLRQLGLYRK